MSSNLSDNLGTVFLWVCFCILSSITYLSLASDEKRTAPQITISHQYIKPKVVVPPPLWSFDFPPPREPPQPTFEPRPEPEPRSHLRNGLIPRAEQRSRPAVLPERRGQRERHMTEMSTRERVAAADREAAKELYQAYIVQELLWRSKAIAHEEAEAKRKQESASRTGGERKQLGIDLEAAKNRPSKAQDIQIERPPGGSNALTVTALGDKMGTAYAPPMDIEEAGDTAQPLASEIQQSDHTPAESTPMAPEEKAAPNQDLASEAQETNDAVADHSSTTAETQFDNPLLKMNDEDAADCLKIELDILQQAKMNEQADDAWIRRVHLVYKSFREWITCGNTLKWHLDKLNEWQTRQVKPMVDEVFMLFHKRCGKRNEGVPADALNQTLAVVSEVRDNMNEALDHLEGKDSGQPGVLDQSVEPLSVEYEKTTSDVQLSNDEHFDHVQEQIAEDQESAKRLHKDLDQHDAQISSDREYAKKVAQEPETEKKQQYQQYQQRQEQKPAPVLQQTYIHDDLADQLKCPCKQDYPKTAVASGSGTYPKDKEARQQVNVPESPTLKTSFKLPSYKVVRLLSEQKYIPSFHAAAGGVQNPDYTPAGDATMVLDEEQVNTEPINLPSNPLLDLPRSEAMETLVFWIKDSISTYDAEISGPTWFRALEFLFIFWSQWLDRDGLSIWSNVQCRDVIDFADFASRACRLIEGHFGGVTQEVKMVCQSMDMAKGLAEEREKARICEEQRQESIRVNLMQQKQLLGPAS